MPVVLRVPPAASRAALMPLLSSQPGPLSADATAPQTENLIPHRAFVMTANDCAAGALPSVFAQYVGWRYVMRPAARVDVATVTELTPSGVHVLAEINTGPFAQAVPEAFASTAAFGETQVVEFELAFLGIPALYLEAFWLRSASGSEDAFRPFGSLPEGLSNELYSLQAWLAAVRPVAQRILDIAARF